MAPTSNVGDLSEWGLEIDFLVAKERPGSRSWEDDDRWACPAHEPNPQEACARHCAEMIKEYASRQLLAKGGMGYCGHVASQNETNFTPMDLPSERHALPPSMCNWLFSASPNATSLKTSPDKLDWVGIRMRSPFKPLPDVFPSGMPPVPDLVPSVSPSNSPSPSGSSGPPSIPPSPPPEDWPRLEVENVLGILRNKVKMHANSTCQLRLHYTLRREGFDLVQAKKMLTLCWMMEPDLFLKLRPAVQDTKRNHFLPITTSSKIAKLPTEFRQGYMAALPDDCEQLLGKTRPTGPEADDMDQHIPKFKDCCLQERIQAIWDTRTLVELADLITSPDGETTIAIHLPGANLSPTMEFRYTSWHPQKDSMEYWLRLIGRIFFFCMGSSPQEFKRIVEQVDSSLLEDQKCEEQERWKPLLTYEFGARMCYFWEEKLLKEELEGRPLSPKNLDCQGILDRVAKIACVSIVDSESNSDSRSRSTSDDDLSTSS
ncbi:hypothetical protein BKA56DRAFT_674573 [Ilyonectria sp. MPI-CAGE-AT-0026]|nr:hypothetical protein BKA56DRAFT_674573 [Ilyonectria sp. MPI-CAGE-AT-0026]